MSAIPSRPAATGFALGCGVLGLLLAAQTLSLTLVTRFSSVIGQWVWPQALEAAALLLVGVAGLVAWAARGPARTAAVAAVVGAVGIVVSGVWRVAPGLDGADGRVTTAIALWVISAVLMAALVCAAAWTWSRTTGPSTPVSAVLVGVVVAFGVDQLARLTSWLSIPAGMWGQIVDLGGQVRLAAEVLLLVAAVLAVAALLGRVPVGPVAVVVMIAGVLLAIGVAHDVTQLDGLLAFGGGRSVVASLLNLGIRGAEALVLIGLGALLLRGGRSPFVAAR